MRWKNRGFYKENVDCQVKLLNYGLEPLFDGAEGFFWRAFKMLMVKNEKIKQKNIDKKQKSNRALFIRMLY
ncbi:hypothetical protein B5G33_14635 [Blautia sp. An81]|nr:hypothetical protein B5G33_14635 [Blautia sp. An81]